MARHISSANLAAENTGTAWVKFSQGVFTASLGETWVATIKLQRSPDAGVTVRDVDSFTANTEEVGFTPEDQWFRWFIETGDFTSGTAVCVISQK